MRRGKIWSKIKATSWFLQVFKHCAKDGLKNIIIFKIVHKSSCCSLFSTFHRLFSGMQLKSSFIFWFIESRVFRFLLLFLCSSVFCLLFIPLNELFRTGCYWIIICQKTTRDDRISRIVKKVIEGERFKLSIFPTKNDRLNEPRSKHLNL